MHVYYACLLSNPMRFYPACLLAVSFTGTYSEVSVYRIAYSPGVQELLVISFNKLLFVQMLELNSSLTPYIVCQVIKI